MSEQKQAGEQSEQQKTEQKFAIQRIYVKDLSFEMPNSPATFTEKWEPKLNVEINTQTNQLNEGVFEVILNVTVTAKLGETTAYLVEAQQAGIFELSGFDEQQMGHMIHSFCPNVLFPYAREVVANMVNRGSFPQLNLAPVNFDAIYAEHLKQNANSTEQPLH
ncbi:MAG: protein-export chaperone SecB [Gammaproteobacteria bacterium]|nr:protein-export chaperone SecB [Gammaproteobacteria bacterium]